jgi:hypothetical protein
MVLDPDIPDHVVTKKYDGLTEGFLTNGRERIVIYDIKKALEEKNPRSVFLNGQLYIENECDSLIEIYFTPNNPIKSGVIGSFLTSRYCDFFAKIFILKSLITLSLEPVIKDLRIFSSLQAVAEIRNAFQHNIEYEKALEQVRRGGRFAFINKSLKDYLTVDDLLKDFKIEVIELYENIKKIV